MPQDSAWEDLHEVERLYLESKFADDDVQKVVDMHSVLENGVRWSDTFKDSQKCEYPLHATVCATLRDIYARSDNCLR